MSQGLFNSFSKMVEEIPTEGILAALEREKKMLEDDLAHKRTQPIHDTNSILSFCHFIGAVRNGGEVTAIALPLQHVTFYRKTLERLIQIGALPFTAKQYFEAAYSVAIQK